MNRQMITAAAIIAIVAGLGGYWLGHGKREGADPIPGANDGRGRILYYRNPMGEPDTSPVPKKDSMGMDYIPVYEHEVPTTPGTVTVDTAKVQRAGVRTEAVKRRRLAQEITAPGTVRFNEAQVAVASPRVEGWIDRLHVAAVGVSVKAGDPLVDIYAPELVQTQQEYFLARNAETQSDSGGITALAQGALNRMKNLGLSDIQVRQLASGTVAHRTITITSPISGVVSEKNAVLGQKFLPGDILYRVADAKTVWVVAKVFERDLQALHLGARATIQIPALSGRNFQGVIRFIAPALDPDTRTADVRIEVPNTDGVLRADMLATVRFALAGDDNALAVPNSAIIDSGTRQIVLVAHDGGRFEPREITTGARADSYTTITKGVAENDQVVVNAAFLIDSESNLKAALQAFASGDQMPPEPKQ